MHSSKSRFPGLLLLVSTVGAVPVAGQQPNGPADFGDLPNAFTAGAPVTYATTVADGGPWHLPGPPIHLGGPPDLESDGQPSLAADGDDLTGGVDDEDGVALAAPAKAGTKATFNVNATNNHGAKAYLHAMVDWNADGAFVGGNEVKVIPLGPGFAGPVAVDFDVPPMAATGIDLGARFRISSAALDPEDPAPDGEIEDYLIRVDPPDRDFGDLPDSSLAVSPSYATTLADMGPSHVLGSDLYLGPSAPDLEPDGQPSITAKGDDTDAGGDDEEGFGPLSGIQAGDVAHFTHTATNLTGGDAWLYAFIDWNGDGDFLDASETTTTRVPDGTAGAIGFSVSVPGGSSYGDPVAARLRLASMKPLGPDGPAPDGEVEDYFLSVRPELDFGDLPDPFPGTASGDFSTTPPDYRTRLADDGPRHVIIPELALHNDTGSLDADIDAESDGQPSAAADGDDLAGDHDELALFFAVASVNVVPGTATDGSDVMIEVELALNHAVRNDLPVEATLHTFIDWNRDGDFEDTDEAWSQVVPASTTDSVTQMVSTSFAWPMVLNWSETWAVRTRLSTDASLDATGLAPDGEVQDDLVSAGFAINDPRPQVVEQLDFGDLPDECAGTRAGNFDSGSLAPDYRTLIADGGPSHEYDEDLLIVNDSGSGDADIDFESDGQPNSDATGDDNDGNHDDLSLITAVVSQTFNPAVPVDHSTLTLGIYVDQAVRNVTGSDATFYAFIDGNRDGDFADPGEKQTVLVPGDGSVTNASATFSVTIPWTGELAWTETFALRFRLSTDPALDANGPAPDGEVQDDLISINLAISDPRPVGPDLPQVLELDPHRAWLGAGTRLDVSTMLPPGFGPVSEELWSLEGDFFTVIEPGPIEPSAAAVAGWGVGTHRLVVTFEDELGQTYVGRLVLEVGSLPGFFEWASTFGLEGAAAAPDFDADGDGFLTVTEFGLGSDPADAASTPELVTGTEESGGDRWLVLSHLCRSGGMEMADLYVADGLHYRGEGSGDLESWDIVPVPTADPAGLSPAPAGYQWRTIRLPDPMSAAARGFLRLDVSPGCAPH